MKAKVKNYNEKVKQLEQYVRQSDYIDCLEQPKVCASFGLPNIKEVFRKEYRGRFFNYLQEHTTTCATVSKHTKIPQKYLCECKDYLEKKGLLEVVSLDKCPTTGSNRVQFLSTNPQVWQNPEKHLPQSNQLSLFD